MAKKTVKKVDVKKVTKMGVSTQIAEMFGKLGVTVGLADDYGFTEGTLVLKMEKCDVQVKIITPKSGVDRYEKITEEEEVEEEEVEEIVIESEDELLEVTE